MGESIDVLVTNDELDIGVSEASITIAVTSDGAQGPPGAAGPPGAPGSPGPPGEDGAEVFVSADPPPDPEVGQLWFDTDDPHTADAVVVIAASPPTLPDGSLWFDTGSATLFVRYLGAWVGV